MAYQPSTCSCYIIRPVDHLSLKGHSYLSPSYAARVVVVVVGDFSTLLYRIC